MPTTGKLDSDPIDTGPNPMITQEAHTPIQQERQIERRAIPTLANYSNIGNDNKSDMLQEIKEIEKNVSNQSSTHDKSSELTETT